jgi:hypothetical protein
LKKEDKDNSRVCTRESTDAAFGLVVITRFSSFALFIATLYNLTKVEYFVGILHPETFVAYKILEKLF